MKSNQSTTRTTEREATQKCPSSHLWLVAALALASAFSALTPSLARHFFVSLEATKTVAGIFRLGVTYITDLLRPTPRWKGRGEKNSKSERNSRRARIVMHTTYITMQVEYKRGGVTAGGDVGSINHHKSKTG